MFRFFPRLCCLSLYPCVCDWTRDPGVCGGERRFSLFLPLFLFPLLFMNLHDSPPFAQQGSFRYLCTVACIFLTSSLVSAVWWLDTRRHLLLRIRLPCSGLLFAIFFLSVSLCLLSSSGLNQDNGRRWNLSFTTFQCLLSHVVHMPSSLSSPCKKYLYIMREDDGKTRADERDSFSGNVRGGLLSQDFPWPALSLCGQRRRERRRGATAN